ncbi:hypothetical protein HYFRA_00004268 [Hymenoscyphus fraxineus]|uniref:Uncharacterized protein n=1 Tax=Hymenoscyphus fraxineus TaxID=746836 RepID=A0A9N9KPZ0_9HELO|nr:hypothetical protein HYFRA_00004268 [Hymenoscyphus fraxineus]
MNTIARVKAAARTWSQRHTIASQPSISEPPAEHRSKRRKQEIPRKTNAQTLRRGTGTGEEWHVTGRYKITSPLLERLSEEDLFLDIYSHEKDGEAQLFAYFDFGRITGVMRFEGREKEGRGDGDCLTKPRLERSRGGCDDFEDGSSSDEVVVEFPVTGDPILRQESNDKDVHEIPFAKSRLQTDEIRPSRKRNYAEFEEEDSSEVEEEINRASIPRLKADNTKSSGKRGFGESEEGSSSEVEEDVNGFHISRLEPTKKRSHAECEEGSSSEEKEDVDRSTKLPPQTDNTRPSKKRSYAEFEEECSSEVEEEDSTNTTDQETYCHVCAMETPKGPKISNRKAAIIPERFRLGKNKWPTRNNAKWTYRWQGEDVGTDTLQPFSEDLPFTIRFGSNRGLDISGTFGSPGENWECGFEGVKIEGGREAPFPIEESWHTC